MGTLAILILFFGGFLAIGFAFRAFVYGVYNLIFGRITPGINSWLFNQKLNTEPKGFSLYRELLYQKLSYFQLLNDKEQLVFVHRLQYIRERKKFTGNGLQVTQEMEVLISAAIAQLTFGLEDDFTLPQVERITITPGAFFSSLVGANVTGLTFESGKMVLSWDDFTEGYRVGNDRLNLGLHELAHALMIGREMPEVEDDFNEWHHLALSELQIMRTNGNGLLRDYASTDMAEFWACCVECFFEAPLEFKKAIPALYAKTSLVLNQDMSERVILRNPSVFSVHTQ